MSLCLGLIILDLPPISTVIPPLSCSRAFCWFSQHSHMGVDIFQSTLLCVSAVIPAVMCNTLVQHLWWTNSKCPSRRRRVCRVTLLRMRSWSENLCRPRRQCDDESAVKRMPAVTFGNFLSAIRVYLVRKHDTHILTHTYWAEQLQTGPTCARNNSVYVTCACFTPAVKKTDGYPGVTRGCGLMV